MNDLLRKLEQKLPGLNYVVSFSFFSSEDGNVFSSLDNLVIGNLVELTPEYMLSDIESCIRYKGDRGDHPDLKFIASNEFEELVQGVLSHLRNISVDSKVWSVVIREGHPFYPVQWDFAYLIVNEFPYKNYLFIGSSSD